MTQHTPGRRVEKNHAADEALIVGRCAGCGDNEAILREIQRNRWRCRSCAWRASQRAAIRKATEE